ncbi:hypothetical protein ES332_A02G072300v1 [Gossypium tomentosum]|uniref:Uncharacterized protein n=1 Tax=Gossypium tomentosum TaxID=34277 RepID=A0A5D2RG12_GOSTO|nr:hypothetical protein ES332_A02G072300v1 [Gossypium tomentosum]
MELVLKNRIVLIRVTQYRLCQTRQRRTRIIKPFNLHHTTIHIIIFRFGNLHLGLAQNLEMRETVDHQCREDQLDSGDNGSRNVLDAFFLRKAVAEALNERIESTIGEFLSVVGRLQAEQQKQVQDFQEKVLERAKRAKEQAAREALEAQRLIPKSTSLSTSMGTKADTNSCIKKEIHGQNVVIKRSNI